jgi:hypothetical protein
MSACSRWARPWCLTMVGRAGCFRTSNRCRDSGHFWRPLGNSAGRA